MYGVREKNTHNCWFLWFRILLGPAFFRIFFCLRSIPLHFISFDMLKTFWNSVHAEHNTIILIQCWFPYKRNEIEEEMEVERENRTKFLWTHSLHNEVLYWIRFLVPFKSHTLNKKNLANGYALAVNWIDTQWNEVIFTKNTSNQPSPVLCRSEPNLLQRFYSYLNQIKFNCKFAEFFLSVYQDGSSSLILSLSLIYDVS